MQPAIKLNVTIDRDHIIRLPKEVPEGPAEVIVLMAPDASSRRAELAERRKRAMGSAAGLFTVPDDFDAPLPPEVLKHFEGGDVGPEGE